jgi:hypothetical protein
MIEFVAGARGVNLAPTTATKASSKNESSAQRRHENQELGLLHYFRVTPCCQSDLVKPTIFLSLT